MYWATPCEYSFHGSKATQLGFQSLGPCGQLSFGASSPSSYASDRQVIHYYPRSQIKDQARAQFVEDVHRLHSESIRTSSSSAQWKSSWSKTWKSYGNHTSTLQFQALQSSSHPNSPYYLLSALHLALFPSLAPGLVFKQLLSISFWKAFHASNPFTCSLPDTLIYLVVNETYTDHKHRTWLQQLFQLLAAGNYAVAVAALNWALKVLKSISFKKLSPHTHTWSHTRRITKHFCEIARYTPQGAFFLQETFAPDAKHEERRTIGRFSQRETTAFVVANCCANSASLQNHCPDFHLGRI